MNRSALKTYAPKARLDFIRAVTDRAAFFGLTADRTEPMQETGDVVIIGGRAFPKVMVQQRRSLEVRIQRQGFAQVIEAIAYTWFNRFVALRHMELHGYLEHGYRVLSHPEGKSTPEILEHAEHVTLPGLDPQKVVELKLDGGKDAELYRLLLVAQCNALHEAMPFLFEKIADETELLLPDNLLHSDSLIRKLVTELDEADWQQVEIIGWLYQFYISDKKDEVIGKVVKSEDIPAATQLFTPNWIVKYLVQNTIGRQWLATYPDSPLRQQMEYYIEPAEQTEEVKAQLAAITPKSLDPETLTLLDPASGSGHILVEAYDLFKAIYQERGYRSKDIPRLILEKNLFGLEIDDRAAQLAAFALLMKARADDRRIFADHVQPNVIAIQESKGLANLLRPAPAAAKGVGELPFADSDLFPQTEKQLTLTKPNQESPLAAVEPCLRELIKLFEHGKTFGSLISVPPELATQLPAARQSIEAMIAKGHLWEHRVATFLLPILKQAKLLAQSFDAVVTNPPYMGSKFHNLLLKEFLRQSFPNEFQDTYTCFISQCMNMTARHGRFALITLPSWTALPTFADIRESLFRRCTLACLIDNGRGVWGPDYGSTAFIFVKADLSRYPARYGRLFDRRGEVSRNEEIEARFFEHQRYVSVTKEDLSKIPGTPLAYWATEQLRSAFSKFRPVSDFGEAKNGMTTGDNDRFLRFWFEVSKSRIDLERQDNVAAQANTKPWVPYSKGGEFRKWYGNSELILYWGCNGERLLQNKPKTILRNPQFYFRDAITWSLTSMLGFGARYRKTGFAFDVNGMSLFAEGANSFYLLGLLNSCVARQLLEILNPTIAFQSGDIARVPVVSGVVGIEENAKTCTDIARHDWDLSETSWDFTALPVCQNKSATLPRSQEIADAECLTRFNKMKELEEQNNKLFIEAYGLQTELSPIVSDEQITLYRADRNNDIARLLSYAIGCMMGRYCLDKLGLVYAHSRNEGFDASQYQTFPADADGIIPITELAWFTDDATERFVEFIGKAWPAEHLEENLKFVADSLGANRDEHPRDTIRRYLSQNFYKDHLQTYKRRPIYWLFSSGKQKAFQCLVYLHRYHEGTLARMRTEYVIPLQGKLSQRIEQLAGDITAATSTSHRRKLEKERETLVKQRTELAAFDEKLRHYADQRIALDLDDGVKVNYAKFGDLLAEVKAVTGGTEE